MESEIIDQLSKKFKTSAIVFIASKELEERGEVVEVENASFCGSYTLFDLSDYFNSLEEIFSQGLAVQTPIVFILEMVFKDPHFLLEVINKSDFRGVTALMIASYLGHLEIVKDILSSVRDLGGSNLLREIINKKRENGSTALTLAQKQGHLEVVKMIESFTM